MVVIKLLVNGYKIFGLGISWNGWYMVHRIGSYILFILGIIFGFYQGKMWWRIIYVEKRFGKIK